MSGEDTDKKKSKHSNPSTSVSITKMQSSDTLPTINLTLSSQPTSNTDIEFVPQIQTSSKPNEVFHLGQIKNMGLVNECDLKELREVIHEHPKLADVFKSSDDLIHALKVISSIKPHDKFSTSSGIFIQPELPHPSSWQELIKQYIQPQWLVRMRNGDDRITNLRAIKSIFVGSLITIDQSLQEREQMLKVKTPVSRLDVVNKLKNEQLINRLAESIRKAVASMENLKKTYEDDANACARIDMLVETIRDRLLLISTSLDYLK